MKSMKKKRKKRTRSTKRGDEKGSGRPQEPGLWKRLARNRGGTGQWNAPLMQDTITGVHNREQAHGNLVPATMKIHSKA